MGTKRDQKIIFNAAVDRTEQAMKEQQALYKATKDKIDAKLAVLRQQADKGLIVLTNARATERLDKFILSIEQDVRELKEAEYAIVLSGYTDNYANTYYAMGKSLTDDVNERILANDNFDYDLNYRKLNTAFVTKNYKDTQFKANFGMTFPQRIKQEVTALLASIRQSLTGLFNSDLSKSDVKTILLSADEVYNQSLNSALRTTRTEVLTGHSGGIYDSTQFAEASGMYGDYVWDATLDGRTRRDHARKDQTRPNDDGFFVFPDGSKGTGPRDFTLSKSQRINCRCQLVYLPEGITPNSRGERLANGTWAKTGGKKTWQEWSETLRGKRSIERAAEYRRERAKELAKRRAEGKEPTKRPSIARRFKELEEGQ